MRNKFHPPSIGLSTPFCVFGQMDSGCTLNRATAQPFQYKGQYGCTTDGATGLVYWTHRYYDPNVGRWTAG